MTETIKPFLRWAGGKTQLLSILTKYVPENINAYYEPFVGSGALLFRLQYLNKPVINDINTELINVYRVIKYKHLKLLELLEEHKKLHFQNPQHYYYEVREFDYEKLTDVEKAARTIYLNKTCFNGLYRVNQKGKFNTPMGRVKNPNIVDTENILKIHRYFKASDLQIYNTHFSKILINARYGDFVYFDPPYYPISETSSFTSYTINGFSEKDQKDLKNQCCILLEKKVHFLLSNSDCSFIRNLYPESEGFYLKQVDVKRYINSNVKKRNNCKELLISNKPFDDN